MQQISPALGLEMGYVYLALPISGFFLVIYSVELFIEALLSVLKKKTGPHEHDSDSAAVID